MNEEGKQIIQSFLSKLSILEYKYKLKESNEEQFNIFTALYKNNDEVKLYSRFISVLLSPKGSHNNKSLFLTLFLKEISLENFEIEDVDVFPDELDKVEYKEIDILIINRKSKQAIIIENKIFAKDCNHEEHGQLENYYNKIRNEGIPENQIFVFYLTLDGHEPSIKSLGDYKTIENMNGKTISYENEILGWLHKCKSESVEKPFLRESIIQFIKLIDKMTNNIDTTERLEIRDLIASSETNMESTKLLIENFKHVKWHTVADFWEEVCQELIKLGLEIVERPSLKNIIDATHFESYKKGYQENNNYGIRAKVTEGLVIFI